MRMMAHATYDATPNVYRNIKIKSFNMGAENVGRFLTWDNDLHSPRGKVIYIRFVYAKTEVSHHY